MDMTCTLIEALLQDQSYTALTQDPVLEHALEQALQSPAPRVHALGCAQVDKVANRARGPDHETLPFVRIDWRSVDFDWVMEKDLSMKLTDTHITNVCAIIVPNKCVQALVARVELQGQYRYCRTNQAVTNQGKRHTHAKERVDVFFFGVPPRVCFAFFFFLTLFLDHFFPVLMS